MFSVKFASSVAFLSKFRRSFDLGSNVLRLEGLLDGKSTRTGRGIDGPSNFHSGVVHCLFITLLKVFPFLCMLCAENFVILPLFLNSAFKTCFLWRNWRQKIWFIMCR